MLLPFGQAERQGDIFSPKRGRTEDQDPVLKISVVFLEMGIMISGSMQAGHC
jgi:hypothetical protein